MAEAAGLPFLPAFLAYSGSNYDFRLGVNFAVAGASALNGSFFKEKGIPTPSNYSLGGTSSDNCKKLPSKSLFLVGKIGGNDYNHPFSAGTNVAEIRTFCASCHKCHLLWHQSLD